MALNLDFLRILHSQPDPASPLTTRQQALDLGFRDAKGEVILTLDGDSAVPGGWISAMAGPILNRQAVAMAGPITFNPSLTTIASWQIADAAYYWQVSDLLSRWGGAGVFFGNFGFRADLYEEVGGFEAIGPTLTEDLAFAQAIQARGHKITFRPDVGAVAVAACTDVESLIDRTMRVSAGPPSLLAATLTLWPLSLLLVFLLMVFFGGWFIALFISRFAVGAWFVLSAIERVRTHPRELNWLTYEVFAFALALRVIPRVLKGERSQWGGQSYER